jgi:hypothetical protein
VAHKSLKENSGFVHVMERYRSISVAVSAKYLADICSMLVQNSAVWSKMHGVFSIVMLSEDNGVFSLFVKRIQCNEVFFALRCD